MISDLPLPVGDTTTDRAFVNACMTAFFWWGCGITGSFLTVTFKVL
jgi:hypothetical protein